jgi:ferredoxin
VHKSTQDFYDMFPLDKKNDFYGGYMYLKYINRFAQIALKHIGLPHKEIPHPDLGELEDGVKEMLEGYVQEIAASAMGGAATDIYHAKVVKVMDAVKLVTQKENLNLPLPEKVVPWKIARDVILQNPQSIAVGPCGCRLGSDKPCLPSPMEVCIMVGDPGAAFIADRNPKFRKITPDEAVKILEDSHKRGDVHCAYFKREIGSRFFAICNCCKCCCMGVKAWNMTGGLSTHMLALLSPSGYVAQVSDDCNGCGACETSCNFDAIKFDVAAQRPVIDLVKCMGCGGCESSCSIGAISLRLDPTKDAPLDLNKLKKELSCKA